MPTPTSPIDLDRHDLPKVAAALEAGAELGRVFGMPTPTSPIDLDRHDLPKVAAALEAGAELGRVF
ncbi:hypothetical protein ACIHJG_39435, partial [Streptomyces sp. NPDC052415]|uniref:hypothetical protein n=1 Tax=Streptomyces sp. NPDC052415 TaxID=3365690 RepID=UPI0037CF698E